MIRAEDVSFEYAGGHHKEPLSFRNVDVHVKRGEMVAILGQSGIGKSTLLRLLSGLAQPHSGRIVCDDLPIHQPLAPVALVVQKYEGAVFPWKTVRQNIQLGKYKPSHSKCSWSIEEIARLLKLDDLLDCFPNDLSGGQSQRVQLGRALYTGADFLLFDEPTSSLDTELTWEFYDVLRQLVTDKNLGVVFVTHDIDESSFFADRLYLLQKDNERGFVSLEKQGYARQAKSFEEALSEIEFREIVKWAYANLSRK